MRGIVQTINENTVKNITLTPANVKKFMKMRRFYENRSFQKAKDNQRLF